MTTFQIKLLAITSMIIGHIGLFFFGDPLLMYAAGRLAFPLFAWLVANGAIHTKNTESYLKRLLIFAFISQVPYILVNRFLNPNYWTLNILFTLFLGLLAITITKNKSLPIKIFILVMFFMGGYLLQVDYGGLGILSIAAFYYFFSSKLKIIISQFIIFSFINLALLFSVLSQLPKLDTNLLYFIPYGILSLIPIFRYTGKQGKKMKYLFYVFYPLQYVVFFIILQYL